MQSVEESESVYSLKKTETMEKPEKPEKPEETHKLFGILKTSRLEEDFPGHLQRSETAPVLMPGKAFLYKWLRCHQVRHSDKGYISNR